MDYMELEIDKMNEEELWLEEYKKMLRMENIEDENL